MKHRKVKYTNEPIGKIKIVTDFLPSPDELVLKEDTVSEKKHLQNIAKARGIKSRRASLRIKGNKQA